MIRFVHIFFGYPSGVSIDAGENWYLQEQVPKLNEVPGLRRHLSWRGAHVVLDPLDFIARLAALVPRPRFNLTRFHGGVRPELQTPGTNRAEARTRRIKARPVAGTHDRTLTAVKPHYF